MVRLFLMILEGPTPAQAHPIFCTEDGDIIRRVAQELILRLAPSGEVPVRRKRIKDDGAGEQCVKSTLVQ